MNPESWAYMPMGGWTYGNFPTGESATEQRKREDRERSRAAMPRRRNTRNRRL